MQDLHKVTMTTWWLKVTEIRYVDLLSWFNSIEVHKYFSLIKTKQATKFACVLGSKKKTFHDRSQYYKIMYEY